LKIKELSDIERLKLSLEYSISDKHRESLRKRIGTDATGEHENKNKVVIKDLSKIGQIGFF
jgi:hypothetical protein